MWPTGAFSCGMEQQQGPSLLNGFAFFRSSHGAVRYVHAYEYVLYKYVQTDLGQAHLIGDMSCQLQGTCFG
jgi:hypothetical protein